MVRAKFKCHLIEKQGDASHVHFMAVTGEGSEENKNFSKLTPAGSVYMKIDDETPAAEQFKQGEDYYLTFEKA